MPPFSYARKGAARCSGRALRRCAGDAKAFVLRGFGLLQRDVRSAARKAPFSKRYNKKKSTRCCGCFLVCGERVCAQKLIQPPSTGMITPLM